MLALLEKALARHPGADAALALAEKLVARLATGEESSRRRLALLRAAHADEYEPARRARLGWRLAAQLEAVGDVIGAVAVLERALEESAPGEGVRVRGERARLLRSLGRPRELAAALEKDAGALLGDARLPVLAEQADLLEAAGEAERALDVRMMALAEFPGAPAVLDDARARLEATGRPIESLALAIAALDHTTDRTRRLALLRDVAVLSEQPDVNANPGDAANAWLAVLGLAADRQRGGRGRGAPAARGGRLGALRGSARVAGGARRPRAGPTPPTRGPTRSALLWRLAELRRGTSGRGGRGPAPLWPARRAGPRAGRARRSARAGGAGAARFCAGRRDRARAAWRPTARRPLARAGRPRGVAAGARPRAATPSATRWRRWISIRATPRRSRRWNRCTRASAAPASWPTSWGGALRGCRRARRRRCTSAAGGPPSAPAIGRAAREAYRRAMSLDPTLAEPVAALGALAAREGDWSEVAKLLESEVGLATSAEAQGAAADRAGGRVRRSAGRSGARGDAARDRGALPARRPEACSISGARFQLGAGNWQAAADALDRLAARGAAIADAAERYFAVGAAAEAAGHTTARSRCIRDRTGATAAIARRWSGCPRICFERGQWDNAWKATEALLERHGAALAPGDRATLLARSAIADLHIGQRAAAIAKLKTIVTRGASYVPDAGIRDVADSWAGHAPRAAPADRRRAAPPRSACSARASEVLALVEDERDPCAGRRWRSSGALAMAEGRWSDALATLEALSADEAFDAERRSDFLVAAGDILVQHYGDSTDGAGAVRSRARAVAGNPSLWHVSESSEV